MLNGARGCVMMTKHMVKRKGRKTTAGSIATSFPTKCAMECVGCDSDDASRQ